jgi:hypothetical protein
VSRREERASGRGIDRDGLDIRSVEERRPEQVEGGGLTLGVIGPVERHDAQVHAREIRWAGRRSRAPHRIIRLRNVKRKALWIVLEQIGHEHQPAARDLGAEVGIGCNGAQTGDDGRRARGPAGPRAPQSLVERAGERFRSYDGVAP